jgi:hypothetical protein
VRMFVIRSCSRTEGASGSSTENLGYSSARERIASRDMLHAMAVLHRFEDVQSLEAEQLNALLEQGGAEERVWALRALALRSPRDVDASIEKKLAAVTARLLEESSETRAAVMAVVDEGAPAWLLDAVQRQLAERDPAVRGDAFAALVRGGRAADALMWLEEVTESDCRSVLARWVTPERIRACAEVLARSSRRLRRMFVETVNATAWTEVAPVIGEDPSLIRSVGGKNPGVAMQIPLATLVRAALTDGSDTWIMLIRDRLRALETPHEVSDVLPDYRELCARRIADIDAQVAELRGQSTDGAIDEASMLEGLRGAFETVYDTASRLLVH